MRNDLFPSGSRVQVTSYGPFRGLKGTVLQVNAIVDDRDEPFCFYHIELDGTTCPEPIWFDYTEVELIGTSFSLLA